MQLINGERYILREGDAWLHVTYMHDLDSQRGMVKLEHNGNIIMVNKSRLRYAKEDLVCEEVGV